MVPAAFQAIANSGGDQGIVSQQVAIINSIRSVDILSSHTWQIRRMRKDMHANVGFRCSTVLPQIGILFNAAAADNRLGPQATPTGPLVCPNPPTLA